MVKFKDLLESNKKLGTYAGWRYSEKSLNEIQELQDVLDLPNQTPRKDIHSTLLYSKKHLPNYKALGKTSIKATMQKLHVFDTFDKKRALVLFLDSPDMIKRHRELMKEHDATYDYPEYIPHITLSYDIGDIEIPDVKVLKGMSELNANEEYQEELNLEWSPK